MARPLSLQEQGATSMWPSKILLLCALVLLGACTNDQPQETAFNTPVEEQDIIAPRVLVIEDTMGVQNQPALQDDLKKSLLLGATRVKDIHVFMSKSFDPKTQQNFQGAQVYSLRSSVAFADDGTASLKIILFEESAQRIDRRVEKEGFPVSEMRQMFEMAVRIALSNLLN